MRDYHCHKSYNNLSINIYKRQNVRAARSECGVNGMMNRDCQLGGEKGMGEGSRQMVMEVGVARHLLTRRFQMENASKIYPFSLCMHMHSMHAQQCFE